MDSKLKGKIISAVRRLTFSYPARNEAKKKQKRDKALYECEICNCFIYEGKSAKTFDKYIEQYKAVKQQTPHLDHIDPVIPLEHWSWSWDDYFERLFCTVDNFQVMCKDCHDVKTKKETGIRTQLRREKK